MMAQGPAFNDCTRRRWFALAAVWMLLAGTVRAADAAIVTATLDNATIPAGAVTKLRIWAKVAPDIEPQADRIFSWYIDSASSSPATAAVQWDQLLMPACDSPDGSAPTSSRGISQGAVRAGIRNTFLTKPGAGLLAPVQLLEVDVVGAAPGLTVFSVSAGTGTPAIVHDFQVARAGGGAAFTGGDYSSASVILTVVPAPDDDLDGLSNSEEAALGSNPAQKDTDQDGLDDLQEYAFGCSLTAPGSAYRPVAETALLTVGSDTALYQTIVIRRSLTAQRVSLLIESSDNLQSWLPDAVLVSFQNHGDGTVSEVYRSPQPLPGTARRYLKATVTRH